MATDKTEVGGGPPALWDGGPTRDALVIPDERVTTNPRVIDRRRLLWRDSATILTMLVIALLAAQVLAPGGGVVPAGSPSPEPSGVVIGSFAPPVSLGPGETFGQIVDPSLGIDATPTPIPVITMGPSPSPEPSPSPSPRPSVKPTPKPTPKPTSVPTPTLPPDTPPPPPPPTAGVSCDAPIAQTVTCTSSSTNEQAGSEVWNMGGLGILVSGGDGSSSVTWTYTDPGSYTVTLTVTGLDGSTTDSATTGVTV
jgi:outer membrane biosynthesis protein TonB